MRGHGVNQIARDTGYSQTWVTQMFKQGLTEREIRARAHARGTGQNPAGGQLGKPRAQRPEGFRGGQKKGADTGQAMIAANREKAVRGRTGETMLDVQLRKEIALADQRELELKIRREEMVSRDQMRQVIGATIISAKDVLLKIAPELKDRLAAESDPARIEALVQGEIEVALRTLAALMRQLARSSEEVAA